MMLNLSAGSYQVRKNGIEFQTGKPISEWTEMTLEMEQAGSPRKVIFSCVVVSCVGSPREGYTITMIFTGVTPQAQTQIDTYFFRRATAA